MNDWIRQTWEALDTLGRATVVTAAALVVLVVWLVVPTANDDPSLATKQDQSVQPGKQRLPRDDGLQDDLRLG